jgi:hypothetical protein
MPTRFKTIEGAYLTVYLSMVFGIILSLLLALIEGAAIGAVRAQSELVADLGLDSAFAEYNREILNQYGLFFIDTSYGTISGGTGMVEAHISDYMSYNMNPSKDKTFLTGSTLLKLKNPYLEITGIAYATDDDCMVWKSQAVSYMKEVYGGDIISTVKDNLDTVKSKELTEKDVLNEINGKKGTFEDDLTDEEITDYSGETEEGYSYDGITSLLGSFVGDKLLALVIPKDATVSEAVADTGPYIAQRIASGSVNKGTGLHDGAYEASSYADELIYGEYLMKMCGNYDTPKDDGKLKYQIEYILYGKSSDADNLKACIERLFAVRAAANLTSISGDEAKKAEVRLAATAICGLLAVPEFAEALNYIVLCLWSLAEAVSDVNILLDGGKIPLLKSSSQWNVGLKSVFKGEMTGGTKRSEGLTYDQYLRVFLGIMDSGTKLERSLDVVEMDIRNTEGNENFRIDGCADYLDVSFGFEDAAGHSFLMERSMCYE